MKTLTVAVSALIVFVVSPVQAEMCRRVDEQGKRTITDSHCVDHEAIRKRLKELQSKVKIPVKPQERKVSERIVKACVDQYKFELKDPLSVYVVRIILIKTHTLQLDARAKNSFGAYERIIFTCPLFEDQENKDSYFLLSTSVPYRVLYRPGEFQ